MFKVSNPIFPQGVIGYYHYENFQYNPSICDGLSWRPMRNGIVTSIIKGNLNVLNRDAFKDINEFILKSAKHFIEEIQEINAEKFWVAQSWLNKCFKGGFQEPHSHANSVVSGVFYIKHEGHTKQPGLTFQRANFSGQPTILYYRNSGSSVNYTNEIRFPVEQGTLIMFPSHMIHGHKVNRSDEERVCLAFNILVNEVEDLDSNKNIYRIAFKDEKIL